MLVTGYKIQQAIRRHMSSLEIANKQFVESVTYFPSQEKPDLTSLFASYAEHEAAIAELQAAQAVYNLRVMVKVTMLDGSEKQMSLHEAVKRVGGAGRGEKMWRVAAKGGDKDRYYGNKDERSKDNEYAVHAMSPSDCLQRANRAGRYASSLREAIQLGNAVELDIDINPALL